jgi:hypothetical protein
VERKRRKILRIALITVFAMLIAGTVALAWFSHNYDKNLRHKIANWVAEATDSTYTAEVSEIRISIINGSLQATNVRLMPDLKRIQKLQQQGIGAAMYYEINIPKISASGIKWAELLGDKEISSKKFVAHQPQLTITRPYNFKDHPPKKGNKAGDAPKLKKLHAGEISIQGITVTYRYISPGDTSYLYLDNGNIALHDWTFEPAEQDPDAFAFAKNGRISFESIRHRQGINLYRFICGQIRFSSEESGLTIKNLVIEPTLSNDAFYKQVGKRVEIFRLKIPELSVAGLNWQKLLGSGEIIANNISVNDATLRVHYSLLLPSSNSLKIGRFPQQMLQKMGIPVDIRNVRLNNALVTYTEVSPLTRRSGTLVFSDINGNINNVTNIPAHTRHNQYAVADLRARFNRGADLKAKFSFYLGDSSGSFVLDGYARNVRAAEIDEASQALALTEIKSLQVDSVAISITGNELSSQGKFTMLYRDLKIGIQKMEEETGEIKGKGFSSFIANKALLFQENPEPGKPIRTATSYVLRKPKAGFFNIIWKNIFQGAANTAARNEELVKLADD